jgi:hypothetical protein
MCSRRDPGRECVRFVTQTTPHVGKDNSARGRESQHHNRAGQSRRVGNGTPQNIRLHTSLTSNTLLFHSTELSKPILAVRSHLQNKHHILTIPMYFSCRTSDDCWQLLLPWPVATVWHVGTRRPSEALMLILKHTNIKKRWLEAEYVADTVFYCFMFKFLPW